MRKVKIVLVTVLAMIVYGIVHDQVTAHVCVEYFTIAHPPLFHTTSPTVLGLLWGVFSTVWIGALFGVLLALVSQSEGLPPVPVRRLYRAILCLLAIMAVAALFAGVLGFELSRRSIISLPAPFVERIPSSRHDRFMAVWFAHGASYLVGLVGATFLFIRVWLERGRPRVLPFFPRTRSAIARALILAAVIILMLLLRFAGR